MSSRLLDQIDGPSDLKLMSRKEMVQVAQEARDTIISVITERGGHLASNLGVVELTLALHRVFDSPTDRIVWDTTNQCYTHKLVTGRRSQFKDIRLAGGLSGFGEPRRKPPRHTLCGPRRHRPFHRFGHSQRHGEPWGELMDHRRSRRRGLDLRLQL